jgi:putative transposase
MPAPMSLNLRLRIREAARRFAVSPSAAIKLMQRVRATGSPRAGPLWRPSPALLAPHENDLRRLVEASADITLAELQAALHERIGIVAGGSTIHNALRQIGLRHKKSP